jgi:hypothetical protein
MTNFVGWLAMPNRFTVVITVLLNADDVVQGWVLLPPYWRPLGFQRLLAKPLTTWNRSIDDNLR